MFRGDPLPPPHSGLLYGDLENLVHAKQKPCALALLGPAESVGSNLTELSDSELTSKAWPLPIHAL